jgi:hypothetical protein
MPTQSKQPSATDASLLARAYLLILSWPAPDEKEGKPPAEKTAENTLHTADNQGQQVGKP